MFAVGECEYELGELHVASGAVRVKAGVAWVAMNGLRVVLKRVWEAARLEIVVACLALLVRLRRVLVREPIVLFDLLLELRALRFRSLFNARQCAEPHSNRLYTSACAKLAYQFIIFVPLEFFSRAPGHDIRRVTFGNIFWLREDHLCAYKQFRCELML